MANLCLLINLFIVDVLNFLISFVAILTRRNMKSKNYVSLYPPHTSFSQVVAYCVLSSFGQFLRRWEDCRSGGEVHAKALSSILLLPVPFGFEEVATLQPHMQLANADPQEFSMY